MSGLKSIYILGRAVTSFNNLNKYEQKIIIFFFNISFVLKFSKPELNVMDFSAGLGPDVRKNLSVNC